MKIFRTTWNTVKASIIMTGIPDDGEVVLIFTNFDYPALATYYKDDNKLRRLDDATGEAVYNLSDIKFCIPISDLKNLYGIN